MKKKILINKLENFAFKFFSDSNYFGLAAVAAVLFVAWIIFLVLRYFVIIVIAPN
jgi:hypothetical protein